ncbi:sodium/glutamate symporter [Clostridium peptidivorans]|uniref:sodium/glutamate symporter n=1 Tax=Clostridium peptidivorans TaxID=100174 RepID=UPI000BE23760|nr:sodium/glutamate symporter [Clostridium peptidivorans]
MEFKLDMMQTTAVAVVMYYLGEWIKGKLPVLQKFCIPGPVVGGIVFALVNTVLRMNGILKLNMDTTLQSPFMMVFFTTIGFTASLDLIKKGGIQVIIFWLCAAALAALQNGVGVAIAKAMGANPLLGIIAGSATMTGGHGTGAAFAPMFEQMGLKGAMTAAMAAATWGLVFGSLIGGPVAKRLIEKRNLKSSVQTHANDAAASTAVDEVLSYEELFKSFTIVLVAIGVGAVLEKFFKGMGVTLPSYVNSMIIAAIILNVGEATGKLKVNQKCMDTIGSIGLNAFLSMALISLKLWELADVAGPMLVILVVQTVMMFIFATYVTFNLTGKDYDATVIAAGHCGFGMGATPVAMANMRSVVERFGPAPRAFFVLPIVGAFLIDFANALIITTFANVFGK